MKSWNSIETVFWTVRICSCHLVTSDETGSNTVRTAGLNKSLAEMWGFLLLMLLKFFIIRIPGTIIWLIMIIPVYYILYLIKFLPMQMLRKLHLLISETDTSTWGPIQCNTDNQPCFSDPGIKPILRSWKAVVQKSSLPSLNGILYFIIKQV